MSFVPVETPTPGVDPRTALATSMYAAPGVYALLLGSGLSSAAGIKTGWQIMVDLVRRVAVAEGEDADAVLADPTSWWTEHTGRPFGYSSVLAEVAVTPAARHAVLAEYFVPTAGDLEHGRKQPTVAHGAIARLVARGSVRVILTTNFDRLLERALEEVGISPQVISRESDLHGMAPLPHAPVTIVKLNGDYTDLDKLNTAEELSAYPERLNALLDRVLDEYGLVICGWSGEWDHALADAIARCPTRRYPTYWSVLAGLEEAGRVLAAKRDACVVKGGTADAFFDDLHDRIERLHSVELRRRRPTVVGRYAHPPRSSGSPPAGWVLFPSLWLRTTASVAPAPEGTVGIVRPSHRQRLVKACVDSSLTSRLVSLAVGESMAPPRFTLDGTSGNVWTPSWAPTPGALQTVERASYRFGDDASRGPSAICTVEGPGQWVGAQLLFTLDIAFSGHGPLELTQAARVIVAGLSLVCRELPEALADLFPPDALVRGVEIHLLAATAGNGNESNLPAVIDISSLGECSRPLSASLGAAARTEGALTDREARELTVEALEYVALDAGFLDPTEGIDELRAALGLDPRASDG
jgi:hypothetical protein